MRWRRERKGKGRSEREGADITGRIKGDRRGGGKAKGGREREREGEGEQKM